MPELILTLLGLVGGAAATLLVVRRTAAAAPTTFGAVVLAEKVRSVGKLVGLEVTAKEIATGMKGWDWLPPIILSPARVAMIFHFEKQYFVDLSRVRGEDVEELSGGLEGRRRYRLRLPAVEGSLRLTDLEPYDIQAGRVLGLLDVMPVSAPTQKELMRRAQEQAGELYLRSDGRHREDARRSIERQLCALVGLLGAEVEIEWSAAPEPAAVGGGSASAGPGARRSGAARWMGALLPG